MKELKLKLEKLGLKINCVKETNSGYEDDNYLRNIKIDIFRGAYQKWDIYIEKGDIEKSFMSDEDLIDFLLNMNKELKEAAN